MSFWTPHWEECLDLRKNKPIGLGLQNYWPVYHQEVDSKQKVYDVYQGISPISSPSHRDTYSPGSVNSYDGDLNKDPEYQLFEIHSMQAMAQAQGGSIVHSNPNMTRGFQTSSTDDEYRKKRQKNNIAAKRSRDRRKMREIKLQIQLAYLVNKVKSLQKLLDEKETSYDTV